MPSVTYYQNNSTEKYKTGIAAVPMLSREMILETYTTRTIYFHLGTNKHNGKEQNCCVMAVTDSTFKIIIHREI